MYWNGLTLSIISNPIHILTALVMVGSLQIMLITQHVVSEVAHGMVIFSISKQPSGIGILPAKQLPTLVFGAYSQIICCFPKKRPSLSRLISRHKQLLLRL